MTTRANCVSLVGLDPSGTETREFWIEKDFLRSFYVKGAMDRWKAAYSVAEVLKSPAVIFQGNGSEGHDEVLVYAGLASHRYSRHGNELPPPPNMTFVVYVREDGVISWWDWVKADPNLTYPLNYLYRFGPQLWPTISSTS